MPRFVRLTNRFHVAVCLFSHRSQMMTKCGKNKQWHISCQASVSLLFLNPIHMEIPIKLCVFLLILAMYLFSNRSQMNKKWHMEISTKLHEFL